VLRAADPIRVQPRGDDGSTFRDDTFRSGQTHAARSAGYEDALVIEPCHEANLANNADICIRSLDSDRISGKGG
jgi:hypothetical protein